MAAIRWRDTKPEKVVRFVVRRLGVKCQLHRKDLPGKPDLVFPNQRKVIFVHGCFWHLHRCRYGRVKPATNVRFWTEKRTKNRERDRRIRGILRRKGWEVLTVWECWTRNSARVHVEVRNFLRS